MQVSMIDRVWATTRLCSAKIPVFAGALIVSCFFGSANIHAQELSLAPMSGISDTVVFNPNTGLALFGYDPVAYYVDGRAIEGHLQFETRMSGLVWKFSNEGNLAAFLADSKTYIPQFGGYDAFSITKGQIVEGNPTIFSTLDTGLYFFRNVENKKLFENSKSLQVEAAKNWINLKTRLVRPH